MSLFLRICSILLYIAFVVLAYYVAVWVLAMLGIQVPGAYLESHLCDCCATSNHWGIKRAMGQLVEIFDMMIQVSVVNRHR